MNYRIAFLTMCLCALDCLTVDLRAQQDSVPVAMADDVSAVAPPPAERATKNGEDLRHAPKRLMDYELRGLETPLNLQTTDPMDIVELIEYLAHKGGLQNIVIGRGVAGPTAKLRFGGIPVGDALEVLLSINNLAYEVNNGIITIRTDEEYKSLYGKSFYDHKQVRVVELKYADAGGVAAMLAPLKSNIGTVVSDPVTGTLILIDTPDKIEEMQAIIQKADITTVSRVMPTETRSFVLQYANIDDIEKQVASLVSKEAGSVRSDRRTKTLIVADLPHTMEKVERLIETFDRQPKQVFIEAKIVEVALSDSFNLGINWKHLFNGIDPRFSLKSAVAAPGTATPVGTLTYNTIVAGGDLSAVLDALGSIGETKLLSNPQIAVMDGEEAMIKVIEDQPYKEVSLESGTTNVTGVTYHFKEVGVLLAVAPKINDDGFITVGIKPEISSISQWYDGPPQEGTPVVKRAYAETTVMVQNGVTIIIGGMIKTRKDETTIRVPFLGDIPMLGRLFRNENVVEQNSETVVFMTPRIVSGEEPFLRLQDIKKRPKPLRSVGRESGKPVKPIR